MMEFLRNKFEIGAKTIIFTVLLFSLFSASLSANITGNILQNTYWGDDQGQESAVRTRVDKFGNSYFIGSSPYGFFPSLAINPSTIKNGWCNVANNPGYFIAKVRRNGTCEWFTCYSSAGYNSGFFPKDLSIDDDGIPWVMGYTQNIGTVGITYKNNYPYGANSAGLILKLNTTGGFNWGLFFGNSSIGILSEMALQDPPGKNNTNIWAVGYSQQTSNTNFGFTIPCQNGGGQYDVYLSRWDVEGNYLLGMCIGGTASDQAYNVAYDIVTNSILITGLCLSQTLNEFTNPNPYSIFWARITLDQTPTGANLSHVNFWSYTTFNQPLPVTPDNNGNFYLTWNNQNAGTRIWMIKPDNTNVTVLNTSMITSRPVVVDSLGNLYLSGDPSSSFYTVNGLNFNLKQNNSAFMIFQRNNVSITSRDLVFSTYVSNYGISSLALSEETKSVTLFGAYNGPDDKKYFFVNPLQTNRSNSADVNIVRIGLGNTTVLTTGGSSVSTGSRVTTRSAQSTSTVTTGSTGGSVSGSTTTDSTTGNVDEDSSAKIISSSIISVVLICLFLILM